MIPLAGITLIIENLLADAHAIFSFLFGILILVYCIGPVRLHEEIEKYIKAKTNGDTEGSLWKLNNILGNDIPDNEPELWLLLAKSILVETCKRILGTLFWFAILGPMGAVLYRTSCLLRDNLETTGIESDSNTESESESETSDAAYRLQYILNWIPARLTALSYALAGSFVHAMDCWRESESLKTDTRRSMRENEEVIVCIGLSSLQLANANKETPDLELTLEDITQTLNLGMRAVIVWVTCLAILTLTGWIS